LQLYHRMKPKKNGTTALNATPTGAIKGMSDSCRKQAETIIQDMAAIAEKKLICLDDARSAGLRYVTDVIAGIIRRKFGKYFCYYLNDKKITEQKTLDRIKKLVIPPAWTNVWINPHANGHLQATGRDIKGRKQYRYHTNWRQVRDENKYSKLISFAESLPDIRRKTEEHLRKQGLPKEKVAAIVVRLLELTCIRIGNEEYVKQNQSFGLTTLRDKHVEISGAKIKFEFKGKSGKMHSIHLNDKRLSRLIRKCREIPGQELFQYIDDEGKRQSIGSADINEYLRTISGKDFTAKDFRTWAGTMMSVSVLSAFEDVQTVTAIKRNLNDAIKQVATKLGNTPAICRKCYIHPAIIELYTLGELRKSIPAKVTISKLSHSLSREEKIVLELLRKAEKGIKKAA
jgi:DNA topoisomerase-1